MVWYVHRTVVATHNPEENFIFQNSNLRVSLIMQFSKVLITSSPYKLVPQC